MTANSINYARQQEDARHNVAAESIETKKANEVERHNKALEDIQNRSLAETSWHNRIDESIRTSTYYETERHNKKGEAETQRHNERGEAEDIRHNSMMEILNAEALAETNRHNQITEGLTSRQIDVSTITASASMKSASAAMTNASANLMNASTKAGELKLAQDTAEGKNEIGRAKIELTDAQAFMYNQEGIKSGWDAFYSEAKGKNAGLILQSEIWRNSGISNLMGSLIGGLSK